MISWSTPCADRAARRRRVGGGRLRRLLARFAVVAVLVCYVMPVGRVQANPIARAEAAYARGDYVRAVNILTPLAFGGDARAQAFLGFMFEHGYGTPQVYDTSAGLYGQAAMQGNPFGQAMFGLMYDKGHGVPQDFVLAYKWLNLAAARAPKRERDHFLRLRDGVASKMSPAQIAEGQRLAMAWAAGLP